MRGILVKQFGHPDVLQMGRISLPAPGPGQCIVKILAAGVNPVDIYIRSGGYAKLPQLPYTPGKDGAGIITAIGERCEGMKMGDRVFVYGSISGTYAEYSLCNSKFVFPLPETLSFAQGACLGVPAFTAYRALFEKAKIQPGENLLVHGASGAVGLAAVQMASSIGLNVYGTAGSADGVNAVLQAGAIAAFNHRLPEYVEEISESCPRRFDVCLEMLASTNLSIDLSLMALGGRVVVIGSRGSLEINPRDIMSRELSVLGVMLANASESEIHKAGVYISASLKSGTLCPVVGRELPLEAAPEAHVDVIERKMLTQGNLVLTIEHQ